MIGFPVPRDQTEEVMPAIFSRKPQFPNYSNLNSLIDKGEMNHDEYFCRPYQRRP